MPHRVHDRGVASAGGKTAARVGWSSATTDTDSQSNTINRPKGRVSINHHVQVTAMTATGQSMNTHEGEWYVMTKGKPRRLATIDDGNVSEEVRRMVEIKVLAVKRELNELIEKVTQQNMQAAADLRGEITASLDKTEEMIETVNSTMGTTLGVIKTELRHRCSEMPEWAKALITTVQGADADVKTAAAQMEEPMPKKSWPQPTATLPEKPVEPDTKRPAERPSHYNAANGGPDTKRPAERPCQYKHRSGEDIASGNNNCTDGGADGGTNCCTDSCTDRNANSCTNDNGCGEPSEKESGGRKRRRRRNRQAQPPQHTPSRRLSRWVQWLLVVGCTAGLWTPAITAIHDHHHRHRSQLATNHCMEGDLSNCVAGEPQLLGIQQHHGGEYFPAERRVRDNQTHWEPQQQQQQQQRHSQQLSKSQSILSTWAWELGRKDKHDGDNHANTDDHNDDDRHGANGRRIVTSPSIDIFGEVNEKQGANGPRIVTCPPIATRQGTEADRCNYAAHQVVEGQSDHGNEAPTAAANSGYCPPSERSCVYNWESVGHNSTDSDSSTVGTYAKIASPHGFGDGPMVR